MSFNVAADIATHKAKSFLSGKDDPVSKSQLNHRIGQEVARTLSEMKGPLMKVGQIFAQVKDVLPPEISTALGQLRQYAKPVPIEVIREQIQQSFGEVPEVLFATFEETPYRAASLGQVHRATLHTGEQMVVKVQYPNVAQDCDADLKHLRNLFRLLPLIGVDNKSLDLIFVEIEEVIRRELDYNAEADAMAEFHDFFQATDRVIVPKPYRALSSKTVITMTFEQGTSLDSVHTVRAQGRGDPEFIKILSENLLFCLAEQIFVLRKIHVDPHAGNFAVKPDGSLVMFDFGAVKELTDDAVEMFKDLVAVMFRRDIVELERLLHEKGIRKEGSPALDETFYDQWFDLFNPPFLAKTFDFTNTNLHKDALNLVKTNWKKHQAYFRPSRDTLLLDRLIVGHYWNFVHLAVEISLRDQLKSYVSFPKADVA